MGAAGALDIIEVIPQDAPTGRYCVQSFFAMGSFWFYGGWMSQYLLEVALWQLDVASMTWLWHPMSLPALAQAAVVNVDNVIYVYGGEFQHRNGSKINPNTLYAFDLATLAVVWNQTQNDTTTGELRPLPGAGAGGAAVGNLM